MEANKTQSEKNSFGAGHLGDFNDNEVTNLGKSIERFFNDGIIKSLKETNIRNTISSRINPTKSHSSSPSFLNSVINEDVLISEM